MTRRNGRPCTKCGRTTKSTTRLCVEHRDPTAIPVVIPVEGGVSFAGLTLTTGQARRLADQIHDTIEENS